MKIRANGHRVGVEVVEGTKACSGRPLRGAKHRRRAHRTPAAPPWLLAGLAKFGRVLAWALGRPRGR